MATDRFFILMHISITQLFKLQFLFSLSPVFTFESSSPSIHYSHTSKIFTWKINRRFSLQATAQLHWGIWRCSWWMGEYWVITLPKQIFPSQSWIWSNVLVSAYFSKSQITGSPLEGILGIGASHEFYFNILTCDNDKIHMDMWFMSIFTLQTDFVQNKDGAM